MRAGDYDARVPVVTSDELGELSHDFNLMAAGLAEREQMRETFGTYLDRDIVGLILSGRFPREGVEVIVSIMFVDVRGFTSFAERSDATEVVAALNALFEVMVPIVADARRPRRQVPRRRPARRLRRARGLPPTTPTARSPRGSRSSRAVNRPGRRAARSASASTPAPSSPARSAAPGG